MPFVDVRTMVGDLNEMEKRAAERHERKMARGMTAEQFKRMQIGE